MAGSSVLALEAIYAFSIKTDASLADFMLIFLQIFCSKGFYKNG